MQHINWDGHKSAIQSPTFVTGAPTGMMMLYDYNETKRFEYHTFKWVCSSYESDIFSPRSTIDKVGLLPMRIKAHPLKHLLKMG